MRDPLILGMRFLSWCNHIDLRHHAVRKTRCRNCVRFMKAELTEKSPTFNFLNRFIGPLFSSIRDPMLTEDDFKEGKRLAAEAMGKGKAMGKEKEEKASPQ